ncbi:MAG: hypothetical protein EP319_04290, partial [Deltaproteobacteria bacterium]
TITTGHITGTVDFNFNSFWKFTHESILQQKVEERGKKGDCNVLESLIKTYTKHQIVVSNWVSILVEIYAGRVFSMFNICNYIFSNFRTVVTNNGILR